MSPKGASILVSFVGRYRLAAPRIFVRVSENIFLGRGQRANARDVASQTLRRTTGGGGGKISGAFRGAEPRGSHAQIFFAGAEPLNYFLEIKEFKHDREIRAISTRVIPKAWPPPR